MQDGRERHRSTEHHGETQGQRIVGSSLHRQRNFTRRRSLRRVPVGTSTGMPAIARVVKGVAERQFAIYFEGSLVANVLDVAGLYEAIAATEEAGFDSNVYVPGLHVSGPTTAAATQWCVAWRSPRAGRIVISRTPFLRPACRRRTRRARPSSTDLLHVPTDRRQGGSLRVDRICGCHRHLPSGGAQCRAGHRDRATALTTSAPVSVGGSLGVAFRIANLARLGRLGLHSLSGLASRHGA